jgi:hypothetical protein
VTSGATFSGTVTFVSSGGLTLGNSQAFAGLVAGFSGTNVFMDLQDITYIGSGSAGATTVSWTQIVSSGANASGTLMVSGGGHSADLTLLGQYVTGNFSIFADSNGGTLVFDPPIAAADSATTLVNAHPA